MFAQLYKDLEARDKKGWETYNQPLTTFNGRDALTDAYEEALDMCAYLCQAIMERNVLDKEKQS